MWLRKVYDKYKDVIPYLFFGVCTTLVNVVVFWICAHMLSFNTMISTVIAWILAVLFAYVTNRKWVFYSTAKTHKEIIMEMLYFFGCRLATGIIDWACMYIYVELLNWNDVVVKFSANVFVIILNNFASKVVILRKQGEK